MRIFSQSLDGASGYGRLAARACYALDGVLVEAPRAQLSFALPSFQTRAPLRFSMYETNKLPFKINQLADEFIVPCTHSKRVFRTRTKKPIHICPLFADTTYSHLGAPNPFRFLCVARDNGVPSRKGIDELIQWFTLAFPSQADVELVIKQSPHCKKRYTFDKRITIIYEDYKRADYHKLLDSAHCGVFLSGMEGWNLPALELMMAGRPSIIVPYGGPADFTTTETSYHIPYKMVRAPKDVYNSVGYCAAPLKDGTIHALRSAYEDSLTLAAKSVAGAIKAQDYTQARFDKRLRDIVAQYGLL